MVIYKRLLNRNACMSMLIYGRPCYGSSSQLLASDQARLCSIQVQTVMNKSGTLQIFSKCFGSPIIFNCNPGYVTFTTDKTVKQTISLSLSLSLTHTHTHTQTNALVASTMHFKFCAGWDNSDGTVKLQMMYSALCSLNIAGLMAYA